MNRLVLLAAVLVGVIVGIRVTRAPSPFLGPADGRDLPAVDTGRVAPGDLAPNFTLESREGERVTLSDLRGRRVLLVFYRGHW